MKKKLVRLTESDLHRIVENSVKRIVKEDFDNNELGYEDDDFEDEEDSFYSLDVSEKANELMEYLGAEKLVENIMSFLDYDTLNEMFDSIHGDIADGNL